MNACHERTSGTCSRRTSTKPAAINQTEKVMAGRGTTSPCSSQKLAKVAQELAQKQTIRPAWLDKAKIDEIELTILAANVPPSLSSPVTTTNLLPTINAAVPIDEEHRLKNAINEISRELDDKLNDLHIILTNDADERETRVLPIC